VFYSCERYPECDFSSWDMPVNEKCPDCGETLFRKKGRVPMIVCHNERCGYKRKAEESQKEDNND
jgi:DNA topoisomerase-1